MTNKIKGPSKAETALLGAFAGLSLAQIHAPATQDEFVAAGNEIKAAGVAGFDTESKPTFVTGDISKGPHVVQFAISDKAFIFQLHHDEGRPFLIDLLQSKEVLKVGFGLKSDRGQIQTKLGVRLDAVLDLDEIFRKDGYSGDMGVRAAVGLVLNQSFHKSKRITTSNWALHALSSQQLLYAANDAFAALKVFEALSLTHTDLLPAIDPEETHLA
ncbi:MAG: 3-5 exonuclease [Rhodocyclales bacterium]|nr:3-5 exonuclease [Rhodocyclales bacterium]